MKNTELLYKTENASTMMVYHYDIHTWRYDCKFWLVGDKWCTDLHGENVVGKLNDKDLEIINKFASIVEQHEKENNNWLAFQKCRKRTCICKTCNKFCCCANCKGKLVDCDKKQLKT